MERLRREGRFANVTTQDLSYFDPEYFHLTVLSALTTILTYFAPNQSIQRTVKRRV